MIGTGVFATPSSILHSVGSVGASLMLWVLGLVLSLCGLFVWLELGTMYPRSGGEKVYLEAVYRRPKHLSTLIFAAYAILLKISSAGCIVSLVPLGPYVISPNICFALGIRPKVSLCVPISTPCTP